MLMQGHDGVLRLFPAWPRDLDARFGGLRAVGAFLVSASLRGGVVEGAAIVSEKGRRCTLVNPWPGKPVAVIRDGRASEPVSGPRFALETRPGERIELRPR
jgi:alpha-L-fucosidase 2